ncbi:hypothetical protein HHI36_018997 [Cryptolaemus montrouzieri]|uniref:Uncharacterized protein n=1 Tax=Cryptolaemus montrouzieri TaxID=559131 RepID=A0ABD2P2C1_9CUCU
MNIIGPSVSFDTGKSVKFHILPDCVELVRRLGDGFEKRNEEEPRVDQKKTVLVVNYRRFSLKRAFSRQGPVTSTVNKLPKKETKNLKYIPKNM